MPAGTALPIPALTKQEMTRQLSLAFAAIILATVPIVTSAQVTVTSSPLVEQTARPGSAYTGSITLRNSSDQPQNAKLYQTDYTFSANGSSSFGQPGTAPRSNAKWVQFLPTSISIPPRGVATASFTVQIPPDTALKGSYWSIVMVETEKSPSERGRGAVGVTTNTRLAVQIATHLEDRGKSRIGFAGMAVKLDTAKKRVLEVDLLNEGDAALRPLVTLELFGPDGALVSRTKQQRGLLYPGTSLRQRFTLGELGPGQYTAIITADGGGEDVFAVQLPFKL